MGNENRKNNVMIGDNDSSHFSNNIIDKCEMNNFIKYVCFMPKSFITATESGKNIGTHIQLYDKMYISQL